MDDEVNFDFVFDSSIADNSSNASEIPQQLPYRSTTASSSGEDLSTYNYGGLGSETYSSSDGGGNSSIYGLGHWDDINGYYCTLTTGCSNNASRWLVN